MAQKITLFSILDNLLLRFNSHGRKSIIDKYGQFRRVFEEFNGGDIDLKKVNKDLVCRFEEYLQYVRKCKKNSSSYYIRTFRAIYNRAVRAEYIDDKRPFTDVFTGNEKTVHRALDIPTLKRMFQYEPKNNKERQALDIFMLCFYFRGMAPVDLLSLSKNQIENGVITYRRRKTGQQLYIKIEPEAMLIMKNYMTEESDLVFASIMKYDYKTIQARVNKYLKQIGKELKIPIPMTMYVARHSWASIARDKNIDIPVISQALGHDNIETTRIYISSINNKIIDTANRKVINSVLK